MSPGSPNGPARPERRRPPGRYGSPPSRRRRMVGYVAYGVVGALLLVGLLLFYSARGRQVVSAQLRGFERTTDSSIRITFSVSRPASAEVLCLVRARGSDGGEVGSEDVVVPPDADGHRETVRTVELPTRAPAVSGELLGCRRRAPR
ncbi:MAG: DUF4307 domain-containing protein [Actinomycetota bacterium]|nr:DUF4307 domain-containing protein [Actinomycetota bacterium]